MITNLPSSIEEIYKKEGLKALMCIPSVGKAIASKIEEYLTTGKIQYLEELRSKITLDYDAFYGLEGIGPKTIKVFYDKLGIRNLSDLEKAPHKANFAASRDFLKRRKIPF